MGERGIPGEYSRLEDKDSCSYLAAREQALAIRQHHLGVGCILGISTLIPFAGVRTLRCTQLSYAGKGCSRSLIVTHLRRQFAQAKQVRVTWVESDDSIQR